jgi:hypothetical protein
MLQFMSLLLLSLSLSGAVPALFLIETLDKQHSNTRDYLNAYGGNEPTQDPRCNNPKNQGKLEHLIIKKSTVVAQSVKLAHKV